MGRRRGLVGSILKDMERASARAEADARRRQRRSEAAAHRALERELVRQERAEERALRRAEREEELRRQTELKEQARAEAEAQKEAQLRAWALEHEMHESVDEEIDRIANDAPEVEERETFLGQLKQPRPYASEAGFEPASFQPPTKALAHMRAEHSEQADARINAFTPNVRVFWGLHGVGALLAAVPLLLVALDVVSTDDRVVGVFAFGVAVVLLGFLLLRWSRTRQTTAFRRNVLDDMEKSIIKQEQALIAKAEQQHQSLVEAARSDYEAAEANKKAEHEAAEAGRLDELAALEAGNIDAMTALLADLLPLDLPVPCGVSAEVVSPRRVEVTLKLPEPSALPERTSRLLASGKVSYKQKPQRAIRDQYYRLVAGLALRYASELLFNLPTTEVVHVQALRNILDPSTGNHSWLPLLRISLSYDTLAPMAMDKLDPIAALTHFEHECRPTRGGALQPLTEV